jgi:iron complex outermembrane receptor protein
MLIRLLALALALAALLAGVTTPARAQAPTDSLAADTLDVALPDVHVEAARGAGGVGSVPFSVAVVERGRVERAADPGGSLDLALRRLPGLFVADRENPALGERLVVRGLGYRAGFGVRGVQVVLDGVPLTLADGQAVLGVVDPALVRRAEIVRGPASSLWGNGSGGVLFLGTVPEAEAFTAMARAAGGAYGLVRVEGEGTAPPGAHRAGLALSHTRSDGYRDHSAFESTRARAFGDLRLSPNVALRLVGAVEAAPRLEHPGALTAEQLESDRRQAETRYVEAGAGKESTQGQAAATLRARTAAGDVAATVYGIARRLDNPLPFAYIAFDRLAGGARLALERDAGPLRVTAGADAAVQHDDRTNRPNEGGTPGADLLLDQRETVSQAALFARVRFDLGAAGLEALSLEGALRGDAVRFAAADRLLADGDQSGSRTLGAWSPQLGLSYRAGPALLFASFATAFETPTTIELVNRPGGGGGFNPTLAPQRTAGVEAGMRGVAGRLLYDVAVYALAVRDGLAPFEGDDGRTYYVNRGRTHHSGAEVFVEWQPGTFATAALTYTWSRLRFGDDSRSPSGEAVGGHVLPGVPEHRLAARLRFTRGGFFVAPEVEAVSKVFADDENTTWADPSIVVDLTLGHEGLRVGRARVLSFVRLQNALDARYVGSVVINAQGARFFEPAAGVGLYAGFGVYL